MELEIPDTDIDGWTVVAASGEIDVAAAPGCASTLTELIVGRHEPGRARPRRTSTSSTPPGLGVLVGAVRRARSADGDVRLVCTNSRILKVFDVTGLDEVFIIESTVDDAVASATDRG